MFRLSSFFTLLLLLTGCHDAQLDSPMAQASTVGEPKASPGKTATRPENLVSVFRSDDLGRSWVPMGYGLPEDLLATHLERWGDQLVLGSSNYGVYLSGPGNQSWQQLDTTTLPSTNINNLYVAEGVIYAGVRKQGIYAKPNCEVHLAHREGGLGRYRRRDFCLARWLKNLAANHRQTTNAGPAEGG
jgi:hypothetical protein